MGRSSNGKRPSPLGSCRGTSRPSRCFPPYSLVHSLLPLPAALSGGGRAEFRFRLLLPLAGGESGARAQFAPRLGACSSLHFGVAAARGPVLPLIPLPGDGAARGRLHPPPPLTRVPTPWPPRRRPHRTSWREVAAPHRPLRRPAPGGSRERPVCK